MPLESNFLRISISENRSRCITYTFNGKGEFNIPSLDGEFKSARNVRFLFVEELEFFPRI